MRSVRNSAKGLILREGKLLAERIDDRGDVFYILPGGGQEEGECLPEALRREIAEELGLDVEVGDLAFVIEGPRGESFHRVDLVFRCYPGRGLPKAPAHADTNQVGADWLDVETLHKMPLYPSKLRRAVQRFVSGQAHSVYLGAESMGDPEDLA